MSNFEVKVEQLTILPHDNADALEIAQVGGYQSVVRKGAFSTGDLAVYIPEGAVVPDDIIVALGLEGKLAGSKKNRVKAVRLRGVLSQGLLWRPYDPDVEARWYEDAWGDERDLAEEFGITKWVPPIPVGLSGDVTPCGIIQSYTEIDNIKRVMDMFGDDEPVYATEKVHGTCGIFLWDEDEGFHVSSKGIAKRGLSLKPDQSDGYRNAYWRVANEHSLPTRLANFAERYVLRRVILFGEVFGKGVQDLHYGQDALALRVFDIKVWPRWGDGEFLSFDATQYHVNQMGLEAVPVLYQGAYDYETLSELASGATLVGDGAHIREGLVVQPMIPRRHDKYGRVIAKFVSDDYLTRKGGTEYE